MEVMISYWELFVLILLLAWLWIAVTQDALRRELFTISILSIFLLPLTLSVQTDQQSLFASFEALNLFDIAFLFALSGIAATVFHYVLGKEYHHFPKVTDQKKTDVSVTWFLRIFITMLAFSWSAVLITTFFAIPLAHALLISASLTALYFTAHRHDLLVDSLVSAGLTSCIAFFASFIASQFTAIGSHMPQALQSDTIFSVPGHILVWSIALGLVLGPLYEYIRRYTLDT